MITINKGVTNSVIMTLTEKSQLPEPNYLFSFTNNSSDLTTLFNMADTSSYPRRYNQFDLVDTTGTSTDCQYAFDLTGFGLTIISGTISIPVTSVPVGVGGSSGTYYSLDYSIDQYVGGTISGTWSGNILSDNTLTITTPTIDCCILVTMKSNYTDGAYSLLSIPYNIKSGSFTAVTSDGATLPTTFDCGTFSGNIPNPRSNPIGLTLSTEWNYGDGTQIISGNTVSVAYPFSSVEDYDIYYSFGVDMDDFPDFPLSIESDVNKNVAFHSINGTTSVTNPSLGQVDLEYGWGKYEVYEAVTATLSVSGTTGRILEEGKYFVSGYPATFNNNDINDIYL